MWNSFQWPLWYTIGEINKTKQKYLMLAKAFWLAIATAQTPWPPKARESLGPCFKCNQEGYLAQACLIPHKPLRPCPRSHREGHWGAGCPYVPCGVGTSSLDGPLTDLLDLAMDSWRGQAMSHWEPQVDITITGCSVSLLLNTGSTCLVLTEFWGPISYCSAVVSIGLQF